MSYALITGGGTDGRYTIELDWGQAQKTALLAALNTVRIANELKIAQQQVFVTAADDEEAAQVQYMTDLVDQYIVSESALPPELRGRAVSTFQPIYDKELKALAAMRVKNAPARVALNTLKSRQKEILLRVAYWTNFSAVESRSAWCCDFTESAAGYVGTVDLPGESDLILIAPGGRAPIAGDGILSARELMSPEQVYFNAAVLPGWQKEKPTYRWGTCTGVDYDSDTMDVYLAPATSSAQKLDVNAVASLAAVPVVYMTCDAGAFVVGDRVTVEFQGQSWASPRVIGFLDNPRGCPFKVSFNSYIEDDSGYSAISPPAGYPAFPGAPLPVPVDDQYVQTGRSTNVVIAEQATLGLIFLGWVKRPAIKPTFLSYDLVVSNVLANATYEAVYTGIKYFLIQSARFSSGGGSSGLPLTWTAYTRANIGNYSVELQSLPGFSSAVAADLYAFPTLRLQAMTPVPGQSIHNNREPEIQLDLVYTHTTSSGSPGFEVYIHNYVLSAQSIYNVVE